ncbi:MAG: hypothetical protein RJB26_1700 [Pseudomonadota bacterium]|jgi:flagellar protein FlaG
MPNITFLDRVGLLRPVRGTGAETRYPAPQGGNPLPSGGKALPTTEAPREVPGAAALPSLDGIVQNLNQFMTANRRDLVFRVDEGSGRLVITVMNPETGEVVRQIPPDELLSVAKTMREAGFLLDARA